MPQSLNPAPAWWRVRTRVVGVRTAAVRVAAWVMIGRQMRRFDRIEALHLLAVFTLRMIGSAGANGWLALCHYYPRPLESLLACIHTILQPEQHCVTMSLVHSDLYRSVHDYLVSAGLTKPAKAFAKAVGEVRVVACHLWRTRLVTPPWV